MEHGVGDKKNQTMQEETYVRDPGAGGKQGFETCYPLSPGARTTVTPQGASEVTWATTLPAYDPSIGAPITM